jgi:homoserine dehydrogenase
MGLTRTRYHVSLDVADRPGVLAQVAQVFARHEVSIETVRQQLVGGPDQTPHASLVVVTHSATDAALSATVDALGDLEVVEAVASVMRVEGE